MGLRLLLYDDTDRPRLGHGLSTIWWAGAKIFRGHFDGARAASSWSEGLEWLASFRADEPIDELQYWGHGVWGAIKLGRQRLDSSWLEPAHPEQPRLDRVRRRLRPGSLVWLRTCSAFGRAEGQRFARGLADFFGCEVAGHTYVIWYAQSGLRSIRPGEAPSWPADEGLRPPDDPEAADRAAWSRFSAPSTIAFLRMSPPTRALNPTDGTVLRT